MHNNIDDEMDNDNEMDNDKHTFSEICLIASETFSQNVSLYYISIMILPVYDNNNDNDTTGI